MQVIFELYILLGDTPTRPAPNPTSTSLSRSLHELMCLIFPEHIYKIRLFSKFKDTVLTNVRLLPLNCAVNVQIILIRWHISS